MSLKSDLIGAMYVVQRFRYTVTGLYMFQVYDWLLLLDDEISLIQRASWTSAKVGYLLCRYYPLVVWPVVIYAWLGDHDEEFCSRIVKPAHIILIPLQLFPQAVMLVRAYAFSGRKKRILAILLPCYATLIALDIWGFGTGIILADALFWAFGRAGCFPDHGAGELATRMAAMMAAAVFMDLVSLVIVLIHAFRMESTQGKLGKTFVQQGLGSFGIVLVVNALAAFIYFRKKYYYDGVGLPFMLVLSNLIAARMILKLRRQASPTDTQLTRQHSLIVRNALAPYEADVWVSNP